MAMWMPNSAKAIPMATIDGREQAEPNAPGYGDQGPAGAGRESEPQKKTAKDEEEPEPVNDLGG